MKKYRKITVNEVIYGWTIQVDDEYKGVRVWKDKKILFDKEIKGQSITPKIVRSEIEKYVKM